MSEDTAATVAELQYKLRRTYIFAGSFLFAVTVAAAVALDVTGHFQDIKALAGLLGPAFSAAVLLFAQYRGGKVNIQAQGQVLHQTNGLLSQHVERAVSKVAASEDFQNVVSDKIADQVISRAALAPIPGGRRKGDPPK